MATVTTATACGALRCVPSSGCRGEDPPCGVGCAAEPASGRGRFDRITTSIWRRSSMITLGTSIPIQVPLTSGRGPRYWDRAPHVSGSVPLLRAACRGLRAACRVHRQHAANMQRKAALQEPIAALRSWDTAACERCPRLGVYVPRFVAECRGRDVKCSASGRIAAHCCQEPRFEN